MMALESTGAFRGRYHVLGGALSPLSGVGPADLYIRELLDRLEPESITEVLLATGSGAEGEATANYIAGLLKDRGVRATRIAMGVPHWRGTGIRGRSHSQTGPSRPGGTHEPG